jgi:hypothetical protein
MKSANRRDFLKLFGSGLIGLTVGGAVLKVSAQEKLSLGDATAKALGYVHKSAVEGAYCDNCMYIKGEDGEEWRPCALFPNNVVAAKGWCSAWMKKG